MAILSRLTKKLQETAAVEPVEPPVLDVTTLPIPGVPKVVKGTFRKTEITLPPEARLCSGIVIYGRLIKTLAFSTDLYIIRNCDADAVLAVAPFTNQPIITKSLVQTSERPVITGVGGNTTTGARSVALAVESEVLGASGVMVNIPVKPPVIRSIARAVDIPVAVTVSEFDDYNRTRINAGATIVNVAAGKMTPAVVARVREAFPAMPIMASGGPTPESIIATINAGADAITWTPPSLDELQKALMDDTRANYEKRRGILRRGGAGEEPVELPELEPDVEVLDNDEDNA